MRVNLFMTVLVLGILFYCAGCQVNQSGTEIRTEEQMLTVSYENDRAEALFEEIMHRTERERHYKKLVGTSSCSLYSRYEEVAFNAHCNDHIKAMDTNGDLMISLVEAERYYQCLLGQGKLKKET